MPYGAVVFVGNHYINQIADDGINFMRFGAGYGPYIDKSDPAGCHAQGIGLTVNPRLAMSEVVAFAAKPATLRSLDL